MSSYKSIEDLERETCDQKQVLLSPGTSHICFVAPYAWPALAESSDIAHIGGAEVQQALLAKALAEKGYQVSMICLDFGQGDQVVVNGIKVYKAFKPDAGIPVLRFVHPRLTSLWRTIKRVNADIYYQRSVGMLTGVVTYFCRQHKKRSIYAGASDNDFTPNKEAIRFQRDRWIYRYGLRRVDAIVTQNQKQYRDCLHYYGRESILIKSISHHTKVQIEGGKRETILWVGTIRKLKRPEIFLEIARSLPEYRFAMIGGPAGTDSASQIYYESIKTQAQQIPNLSFFGFVPFHAINEYFYHAKILVNTSEYEGFPNTFLQAWQYGVPTVSFFDITFKLEGNSVYPVVVNVAQAIQEIRGLMTSPVRWDEMSKRCLCYLELEHSPQKIVRDYENLFHLLLRKDRPKPIRLNGEALAP